MSNESRMPADHPDISILLPCLNARATLASCLRSIERQTEPNFECILVDDGSTDRTAEVAQAFSRRDARFRYFPQPHRGLVASLLTGMRHCRAPLIARIDADDWMHRDRLKLQRAALEENPKLDAVGCHVRIFPRENLKDGRRNYESWLRSQQGPETIWRDRFIECPVAHPTLMIRRAALEEHPYRDRGWPEDYDLLLRILRGGPKVGIVARRLVGWRDLPSRLSRTHQSYTQKRFTACRAWHLSTDFLGDRSRYVLWGHGRTGRALRKELLDLGHRPAFIVEVHPRRIGQNIAGAEVISPDALAKHRTFPIIASVAGADPRREIRTLLDSMEFLEGEDYVVAA